MLNYEILSSNSIPIFFFTDATILTSEEMMVGLAVVVKNYKGRIIVVLIGEIELTEAEVVCVKGLSSYVEK